jgi:phosphoglycolate phosphatase
VPVKVFMKNISEDRFLEHKDSLLQSYEEAFSRNIPVDAEKYILPGVEKLLSELVKTDNMVMLYTGDSRGVVESVFNATGLGKYFRACFYGTEVNKRADMITLALNKAKEFTGKMFKGKDVVIIGDSIRDIEVGKQFKARTIAVATGIYSMKELADAGADCIYKDLTDYKAVILSINEV